MRGSPTDFWAKLERHEVGDVTAWHPLVDHCADVAACCEALLARPLFRRRIARLAGIEDFDEGQQQRLCIFAALHDAGKYNAGFQRRIEADAPLIGHVKEIVALFESEKLGQRLAEALDFDELGRWSESDDGTCRLLIASISHHGRPHSPATSPSFSLWRSSPFGDPFLGLAQLVKLTRAWFPEAWSEGVSPLPDVAPLQHALCGLVTLADWIGSDTRFFPFSEPGESELDGARSRLDRARLAAGRALREVGLDITAALKTLGREHPNFAQISAHPEPRPAQRLIGELPIDRGGSVTVLEATTGSGKTEAALLRFLALFQAGEVAGLYFALPTRTAATQIHRRVVEATARAFPNPPDRPPVVLAVPGYLRVDESEGTRLPGFSVLWSDDNLHQRARGWAAEHPKRYLAGAVVVGTIDQVLLSVLQVSHSHLRAAALLRHLLVVDEVHASDSYMNHLLEAVLQRHLAAGGHALLMSATLSSETRARLLAPGDGEPNFAHQSSVEPYPLITHRPGGSQPLVFEPGRQRSTDVTLELQSFAEDPTFIAQLALDAALAGAKVLVLRNTVKDCLATQIALEELAGVRLSVLFGVDGVVAPHHSRFAREDREALDLAIEARFGKDRPDGGCVAVTTQTVQQSLDLDADLMLTDLCPMDVLLQRMGRLHRHGQRKRPVDFERPRLVVLTPAERDLATTIKGDGRGWGGAGLGSVYQDLRVIQTTWEVLEHNRCLSIPAQSRELVEATLHSRSLRLVGEKDERWRRHQSWVVGSGLADKRLAGLNLADWSVEFGEHTYPTDRRVQTRLGQGDRLLRFPETFRSPFGSSVQTLTLSAYLSPSAPDDAEPTIIETKRGLIRFSFAGQSFTYDRLGLRPDTLAQGEHEEDHD